MYNKTELKNKSILYRGRNDLSQKELAKLCKVSRETIVKVENETQVRPTTVIKIECVIKEQKQ